MVSVTMRSFIAELLIRLIAGPESTACVQHATTFLALVRCDSDQNTNHHCNREAEAIIQKGTQSTDVVKRKALLTQASKMIMDDYPIIPLVQYSLPRLLKPYVGGYSELNPQDHYRSKDFYIIKH